jgi:hypothetical protein
MCNFIIFSSKVIFLFRSKLIVLIHGTSTNNGLQFVVAAKETSSAVATTHPFALRAQGRLQAGTLGVIF